MNIRNWIWTAAVALMLPLSVVGLGAPPLVAQVVLDLRDADLRSFVEIVAEATGRNFVLDPQVRGTVTVLVPDDITPAALYEVFLNVLELNRLTLVEGIDSDRIVPMSTARELSPGSPGSGEYETHLLYVRNISVPEVVEVIRPLLPAEAVLSTVPSAGLLILSDRVGNHRRIEALVGELDRPRALPIEMIRLRNGDAVEVLQVIQSMAILPEDASISVDRRSNALVISANPEVVQSLRILVGRLDAQRTSVSTHIEQVNYADAAALADVVLRSFSGAGEEAAGGGPQLRIVPEPQTNSLLLTGPQEQIQSAVVMIRHLDRRPTQVLVEAVIFEMSVEGFSDLSFQFGAILDDAVVGGVQFALEGRPSLTSLVSNVLNGGETPALGNGGIAGAKLGDRETGLAAFLSAIAQTRSTKLLSTPSILTLNNQEAEIVVAQNVPFVTGSFSTVGESALPENPFQTIERQDVGLTLTVTPQINADKTVRLDIKQEVSNLTNSSAASGGEITNRRALSTTVLVRDGNVIMLGGLLEDGAGTSAQKVPGLGDLPGIGRLFRGKNTSKNQRVLLIMLRPRIIDSDAEAKRVALAAAREAKRASLAIELRDADTPRTASGALPFDGHDLNQPFDSGMTNAIVPRRSIPAAPTRRHTGGYDLR